MATGLISVPKPNLSAGLPKMNLPNIQHPLSRMGSVDQLSVRGESNSSQSLGLGLRAKTLLALSEDKSMLPPLTERSRGSARMDHSYPVDVYGSKIPGDKGKFRNSVDFHPKYTVEELLILIQDRLVTGIHGVRCLFKNHDPTGQGHVSKEALQRILHSLIGYIPVELYHKLIKMLGLDNRSSITFEDFVMCFKESEAIKKEWMNTVKKASIQETHPEEHLRQTDFSFRGDHYTAAYTLSILRDKFRKSKGVNILNCLPQSSLEVGGRVVPGHLGDLIKSVGLKMTGEEFKKLWSRFDTEGLGTVKTVHFLKVLGLDDEGRPRPYTTPRYVLVSKDDNQVIGVRGGVEMPSFDKLDKHSSETNAVVTSKTEETPRAPATKRTIVNKGNRSTPRLERVLDCLYFKFEDNYNALKAGLQLFDFVEDGHVSKIDFRQVLSEFGLKVQALDLEQFLSKCGIRTIHGQIDWKEFLAKFWNKSDSGIVHRIVTSKLHVYFKGVSSSTDHCNPEELEAKLVDFFHKDFLHLLAALKKCDKYQIGVVTQHEFKECVERTLGYSMNESQFEQLKRDVGLDADGLVPYAKFMEKFSAEPGLWNKRLEGEFSVRQVTVVTTNTMAPALDRLKFYSDKSKKEQERIITAEREKKTNVDILKERISRESEKETVPVVEEIKEKTATPEEKKKEQEVQKLMSTMLDKPLVNRSREGPDPSPPQAIMPEDHLGNLLQRGPDRMDRHESGIVHPAVDHNQEPRSLTELHNILHELFKQRFHSVDKAFKQLDRKMTGRFNKQQFMEFLKDCEVYFTMTEINDLWNTFETSVDGMYNFSTLVRHVTEYCPRPPTIKGKLPIQESKMSVEQARQRIKEQKLWQTPRRETSRLGVVPVVRERSKIDVRERDELLDKVKPHVIRTWEILKTSFRQLDKYGRAVISMDDMKDISKNLNFDLTDEEAEKLFLRFDFLSNGSFHYIEFLKMYTERVQAERPMPANTCYSKLSYKLEKRYLTGSATPRVIQPTIADVIQWVRIQLLKDWKSVKRAFKRYDSDGKGYLTATEFKNVLRGCGIQIGEEDLYHVMSEFDPDMQGRVSYEVFLDQLLTTV